MAPLRPWVFAVSFTASPKASAAVHPNTENPLAFDLPTYFRKVASILLFFASSNGRYLVL